MFIHRWEARKRLGVVQGNLCHYCGVILTWKVKEKTLARTCATLDHIIPVSLGGRDHIDNFVVCCSGCNSRRGNTPYHEYVKGGWRI